MERSGNWVRPIRLIRDPVKCLLAPGADVLKQLWEPVGAVESPSHLCPQRVITAAKFLGGKEPATPQWVGEHVINTGSERTPVAANISMFLGHPHIW